MRQLARFDEETPARTLADALVVEGIESRLDESRDGGFVLWVIDERELDRARELYELFVATPNDPRFAKAKRAADKVRDEKKRAAPPAPKPISMRARWATQGPGAVGPVTYALIALSVGLALVMAFTSFEGIFRWLAFTSFSSHGGVDTYMPLSFAGIRDGQVWRLVTPTFMHAPLIGGGLLGPLHLVFNMWWLKDLGTTMERAHSGLYLVVFVVVVSIIANTTQYVISGPFFYGFSGVVNALFAYLWVRAKVDVTFPIVLPPSFATWIMGWYILGLVGIVGSVANGVHTAGLVCGALWALVVGKLARGRRR